MVRRALLLIIGLCSAAFADTGFSNTVRVSDSGGTPACTVGQIKVSPGTLSCSGNVATVTTGGGGGGGGSTNGTITAAPQFSLPYYSLPGSTTTVAAFPGVTVSTNTNLFKMSTENGFTVAGSTQTPASFDAGYIVVKQNFAYETSLSSNSLTVFDVTVPASPKVVRQITTASGGALDGAEQLEISGNTLFVIAKNSNRISAYDISKPANPVLISSLQDNTNLIGPAAMRIVGRYAYIADLDAISGSQPSFTVVDIGDPSNMSVVGTITDSNFSSPVFMQIRYPYAYITNESASCKLNIVDISVPSSPRLASTINPNSCTDTLAGGDFYGKYYYIAGQNTGRIYTIDVSSPEAPYMVSFSTSGWRFFLTLKVVGNYLWVTNLTQVGFTQGTLNQFSLADPSLPVEVSSMTDSANLYQPDDLYLSGNYLYVTTHGKAGTINGGFGVVNLGGMNVPSLQAGSVLADELEATHDIQANRFNARTSLTAPNAKIDKASVGTLNISSTVYLTSSAGTDGQVLTTHGSGSVPTWTTVSSGGGGSSTLAVTTGTSTGFQPAVISSPTAVINFDNSIFSVALKGGATAYVTVPTNATLNIGNFTSNSSNFQVDSNGVGIGAIPSAGRALNVSGVSYLAGNTTVANAWLTSSRKGLPSLLMDNAGTNWGNVANRTSGTWQLGYGSTQDDIGTAMLSWSESGQTMGPGNSFVATTSSVTFQGAGGIKVNNQTQTNTLTVSSNTVLTGGATFYYGNQPVFNNITINGTCTGAGCGTGGGGVSVYPATSTILGDNGIRLNGISANSILKNNASQVVSSSTYQDVVNLFSTCSGTQYLGADGSCHSASGSPGGANGQFQYNSSGSFGGTSDYRYTTSSITYDNSFQADALTAVSTMTVPNRAGFTPSGTGQIGYDTTNNSLESYDALAGSMTLVRGAYVSANVPNADVIVATTVTTTETPFGTQFTLPANFFTLGKSIRITWGFEEGCTATVPTRLYRARLVTGGGTNQYLSNMTATTLAQTAGAFQGPGHFELTVTCVGTGASGQVMADGYLILQGTVQRFTQVAYATVDTTQTNTIQLTLKFGAGTTGNSDRMNNMIVEVLN